MFTSSSSSSSLTERFPLFQWHMGCLDKTAMSGCAHAVSGRHLDDKMNTPFAFGYGLSKQTRPRPTRPHWEKLAEGGAPDPTAPGMSANMQRVLVHAEHGCVCVCARRALAGHRSRYSGERGTPYEPTLIGGSLPCPEASEAIAEIATEPGGMADTAVVTGGSARARVEGRDARDGPLGVALAALAASASATWPSTLV